MDQLSKLSILTIPFSVIISVCYLWGYWGTFAIDIFSFLTASDIIVLSTVPLLGVGVFSVIGIGVGSAIHQFEDKTEGSENKNIIAAKKAIKLSDKVFLVFIVLTIFFGGPSKWLILPMLFALLVTTLVFLSGLIENDSYLRNQLMLVFIATLFPLQAYGYGKYQSLKIEEGSVFKYITNEIKGLTAEEKDLRYLGKAGNDIFIYHAKLQQIVVISRSLVDPLRIRTSNNHIERNAEQKRIQPN